MNQICFREDQPWICAGQCHEKKALKSADSVLISIENICSEKFTAEQLWNNSSQSSNVTSLKWRFSALIYPEILAWNSLNAHRSNSKFLEPKYNY